MYPTSFNKQSKTLLKTVAKSEYKINYKNLSYKIILLDVTFHGISFLKKYGSLFSLLKNLVTRKMTANSANTDQMSFIINLMHGYYDWDFDKKAQIDLESGRFHSIVLTKANDVSLDTNKNLKKGIKSFFPKKLKEFVSEEQKSVLLNTMNLYNSRNKTIGLFENKAISLSMYVFDAKSDGAEESEQRFDESKGERVKLRRQKADDKTDEGDNDDEKPDTTNIPELESDKSAEQRRNQTGQGLETLTPEQILSRLPISLAKPKAGNNSLKM